MQSKWFDGLMVLMCVYNEYLGCNLNLSESISTFEVTRWKSVSFDYEIKSLDIPQKYSCWLQPGALNELHAMRLFYMRFIHTFTYLENCQQC